MVSGASLPFASRHSLFAPLIPPEHDRGDPAGEQRGPRRGEAVEQAVLVRAVGDELLEPDLLDFDRGVAGAEHHALGEQDHVDDVGADRNVGGNADGGAKQMRGKERDRVWGFAIEPQLAVEPQERLAEWIGERHVAYVAGNQLWEGHVLEPDAIAPQDFRSGDHVW